MCCWGTVQCLDSVDSSGKKTQFPNVFHFLLLNTKIGKRVLLTPDLFKVFIYYYYLLFMLMLLYCYIQYLYYHCHNICSDRPNSSRAVIKLQKIFYLKVKFLENPWTNEKSSFFVKLAKHFLRSEDPSQGKQAFENSLVLYKCITAVLKSSHPINQCAASRFLYCLYIVHTVCKVYILFVQFCLTASI